MRIVGWFEIVVGAAVAGLSMVLLATGQVPEVPEGRVDIWFHLVAELLMAGLLIAAGRALLHRAPAARMMTAAALGAVAYSIVNSSGYYAEAGEWAAVGMFVGLLVAVAAAFISVVRHGPADPSSLG